MIPILIGLALIFLGIFGSVLSLFLLTSNNAYVFEYSTPIISKIEGKIVELNIENNSTIKKGEIILKLDEHEYIEELQEKQKEFEQTQKSLSGFQNEISKINSEMKIAQANIQKAKLNLENANDDYVRYKNAFKDGAVTQKDLDKAIKNLEIAQNQNEECQKELQKTNETLKNLISKKDSQIIKAKESIEDLQEAKLELAQTTLSASKNGTIANLAVKINDEIEENQKIADIILDDCYVVAKFNKIHSKNLKLDQKASVKIYSAGFKTFEGKIIEIMPENNNLIPIKIKISNNHKNCNIKSNSKAFVKIKTK